MEVVGVGSFNSFFSFDFALLGFFYLFTTFSSLVCWGVIVDADDWLAGWVGWDGMG